MADAGYIAPEEVRHHDKRNVLTNFLGGHGGKVKADVRWLRLQMPTACSFAATV